MRNDTVLHGTLPEKVPRLSLSGPFATTTYIYEPLPSTSHGHFIRLLTLLLGHFAAPLRCLISPVAGSQTLEYEALSYVWGVLEDDTNQSSRWGPILQQLSDIYVSRTDPGDCGLTEYVSTKQTTSRRQGKLDMSAISEARHKLFVGWAKKMRTLRLC
jgi:hypothetical protein